MTEYGSTVGDGAVAPGAAVTVLRGDDGGMAVTVLRGDDGGMAVAVLAGVPGGTKVEPGVADGVAAAQAAAKTNDSDSARTSAFFPW
jgi:hypothetical protein